VVDDGKHGDGAGQERKEKRIAVEKHPGRVRFCSGSAGTI
jgi:hypothetical protein